MDINENLMQINSFLGGMNTDTSDSMIKPEQYRFAENLRLITNTDSNTGELHLIEGTGSTDCIKSDHKRDIIKILAATSIRQYGIIVAQETDGWSIYKFTKERESSERIFGPCSDMIGTPCLLTRWESPDVFRLYIADGEHQIMALNIKTSYTNEADIPTEIQYLTSYTDVMLLPLHVEISDKVGQLNPAKVQYAYRLYSNNGSATKLSPLTNVLSLYKNKNEGYPQVNKTGRAVDIILPEVKQYLDHIQLFRITYRVNGQVPEVKLIYDQKYTPNSKYVDTGTNDIADIAVPEFVSYLSLGIVPKVIESKNDYLFAGNIRYAQSDVDKKFEAVKAHPENYFELTAHTSSDGYDLNMDDGQGGDAYKIQVTSFRPNETYRFGVILYDTKGNASSVIWVNDLTLSDYSSYNWLEIDTGIAKKKMPSYTVYPVVVKVRQKANISGCSKYEVVRCIRGINDKNTISQGIIGRVTNVGKRYTTEEAYSDYICSSGLFSLENIEFNYTTPHEGSLKCNSSSNIMMFASPEYVYQSDDMKDIYEQYSGTMSIDVVAKYKCITETIEQYNAQVLSNLSSTKTMSIPLLNATDHYLFDYTLGQHVLADGHWATLLGTNEYSVTNMGPRLNALGGRNSGRVALNYMFPCVKKQTTNNIQGKIIDECAFPKVPEYNTFSVNDNVRIIDDVTRIANKTYVGWTACGLIWAAASEDMAGIKENLANIGNYNLLPSDLGQSKEVIFATYFTGTSGKSVLFRLNDNSEYDTHDEVNPDVHNNNIYGFPSIDIVDIRKTANPYGGESQEARENSVYYSFGQVFDANDNAEHDMQCGDCYISLFVFNSAHTWYDTTYTHVNQQCTVYAVPLFSDIDIKAQYGHRFVPGGISWNVQDEPVSFRGYTQDKGAYLYDTSYNANPDVLGFTTSGVYEKQTEEYDVRVHFSEQKTNGEKFDNWLQFKAANFLDVDSRHGAITDMRLFKDKLIFWQEHATGLLAVNERIVLQDSSDTQVTLGTGGVLERSDYFSTTYGMKANQFADTQSNRSLYWWDEYNKEILQYTDKYSATPLNTTHLCKNYMNKSAVNDNPKLLFDQKYNEVLCQCVNNETLVFNEDIQKFTSVYKFMPMWTMLFDNEQYILSSTNVYKNNVSSNTSTLFDTNVFPKLEYVVNSRNSINKTFDIQMIGGRFYGGDEKDLKPIQAEYKTPLKQKGELKNGEGITNREYDFRLNIPRDTRSSNQYGGRLKGKTMQSILWSTSNNTDFSIQYITTKYRISWA